MQQHKPDDDMNFERASIERERVTLRSRLRRLEKATTLHANSFLIQRWKNLKQVRRPMMAWLLLATLLIAAGWFQTAQQQPLYSKIDGTAGGAYIEGAVGEVETLNPIFATNAAERSISKLLFAGLLRIDENGVIAGDLAESWAVEESGRVYSVTLRPNLTWTDGKPITSKDVLFTINAIQAAASRSPLLSAWNNIRAEAVDELTVKFTLEVPYAPFPNTLTVGILPEHILSNVQPEQLRNASFNSEPAVTSGPFKYRGTVDGQGGARSQIDVYLTRNDSYHLGQAKLARFTMRVYEDQDALVAAMRDREIMAASDIPNSAIEQFADQDELRTTEIQLFSGVFAFFKTSAPPLDDKEVRQALRLGSNIEEVISAAGGGTPMNGPLLPGQLGFDQDLKQATGDVGRANQLLDKAGWTRGDNGVRAKDGKPLSIRIVSLNSGEYGTIVQTLQKQWQVLGVETEVELSQQDNFQSNVIAPRAYDVLVYELAIGRDSDVYAFWHSSQAAPGRLNLSEYKSDVADEALASGRSLIDSQLRSLKYQSFAKQWLADTPAIALYQPNLYYVQLAKTQSVSEDGLGDVLERFADVQYWTAETTRVDDTR